MITIKLTGRQTAWLLYFLAYIKTNHPDKEILVEPIYQIVKAIMQGE